MVLEAAVVEDLRRKAKNWDVGSSYRIWFADQFGIKERLFEMGRE